MEIDKILFEQFSAGKVDKSFEDLDVNSNGKITKDDLSLTQDNEISNAINTVLNFVDDEDDIEIIGDLDIGNVKTSATADNKETNRYGIMTTNAKDFTEDVLNSKGTVYVTIGNIDDCGPCWLLAEEIQKNKAAFDQVAQVYSLSSATDPDLCWQIYRDMAGGDSSKPMSLPQIAKFVDGKFVQLMPRSIPKEMVKTMLDYAKGSAVKSNDGVPQTSAKTFENDILNSKGTTYVTITSACQYSNWLHHQVVSGLDDILGKVGYYELNADNKDNLDLCWKIYSEIGGGDGSKPMSVPQIAKFVDGKFVELISTTRDFGSKYPDNATINEMLEKAEGIPVNNALGNNKSTQTSATTSKTNSGQNLLNTNSMFNVNSVKIESGSFLLRKIQSELKEIKEEKEQKENEYEMTKRELEKLQTNYEEAQKKAENGENMEFELTNLKLKINNLNLLLSALDNDIERLNAKYTSKKLETEIQK